MKRVLSVVEERFPIAGAFTISRGTKTEAEVITCMISDGARAGRGECVPYKRYGETMDGVRAAIEEITTHITSGLDRKQLIEIMKPGAARNAVDCALWDLEAKQTDIRVAQRRGLEAPVAFETAFTLSLAAPEAMAAQARTNRQRPLLNVKIGVAWPIAALPASS